MKKLLIISEREKDRFFIKLLKIIFKVYTVEGKSFDDVNTYIEDEAPDYTYLDLIKPIKENKVTDILNNSKSKIKGGLRISILNTLLIKEKFSRYLPFNLLSSQHEKLGYRKSIKIG